jgi:hypothetical protein
LPCDLVECCCQIDRRPIGWCLVLFFWHRNDGRHFDATTSPVNTVDRTASQLPRIDRTSYWFLLCLLKKFHHERTVGGSSEEIRTSPHESLESPTVLGAREEIDLAFQGIHRDAMLRRQDYERADLEPHWEVFRLPDSPGVFTWPDDFQRSDPPHNASEVAEEYVTGFDAAA